MGKFSDKYDLNKAKLLKQLIEKSYKKGNFTLSSGKKSSHYLNCNPVSLNGGTIKDAGTNSASTITSSVAIGTAAGTLTVAA